MTLIFHTISTKLNKNNNAPSMDWSHILIKQIWWPQLHGPQWHFESLHLGLYIDNKAPSWWIQYGLNSNMNKTDLITTWKDYSLYMVVKFSKLLTQNPVLFFHWHVHHDSCIFNSLGFTASTTNNIVKDAKKRNYKSWRTNSQSSFYKGHKGRKKLLTDSSLPW